VPDHGNRRADIAVRGEIRGKGIFQGRKAGCTRSADVDVHHSSVDCLMRAPELATSFPKPPGTSCARSGAEIYDERPHGVAN
jgi:hypothetical protein